MCAHRVRNVQFIGVGSHKAALPTRSFRSPVSSINPYLISWLQGGSQTPMVAGIVLIAELGIASHFMQHHGWQQGAQLPFRPVVHRCECTVQSRPWGGTHDLRRRERHKWCPRLCCCRRIRRGEVVCPIVLKVTDVGPKVLFHDCRSRRTLGDGEASDRKANLFNNHNTLGFLLWVVARDRYRYTLLQAHCWLAAATLSNLQCGLTICSSTCSPAALVPPELMLLVRTHFHRPQDNNTAPQHSPG